MPRSDGRGNHHVRAPRAIRAALLSAMLLSPAAFVAAWAPPAAAQDDPYVQRGVPAEATAENAVVARERAMASAQRIAYGRMAAATGRSASASQSQIESMVQSMVVEEERTTRNGYSGRFTVRFRGAGRSAPAAPAASGDAAAQPRPSSEPRPRNPEDAAYVPPSGVRPLLPLTAYLDAATRFGSMNEWIDLRRRLLAHPAVGSVDVVSISTESARLRLGLRSPPNVAAEELAAGGILLAQAAGGPPGAPNSAPVWRVGLAGGP
ncbi:hypothetical protein [Muricoccus radiodurans]|uniref:hypothetical protein n=1 Tax=Muricoccus radiodurans TaxID=2231721 RepID=UPI003CF90981